MAIKVMGKKNISNRELARKFGIDESTIRYHLAREGGAVPMSNLLIIDEVGYRPLNAKEANLFFGLILKRYENASTIITSNKSVREWPELLSGDEVLASAILDRLLHHTEHTKKSASNSENYTLIINVIPVTHTAKHPED